MKDNPSMQVLGVIKMKKLILLIKLKANKRK